MEHILACPKCNGANRTGQLFCRFCGQSLAHKCARCQVEIDPAMGSCPYCGEILPIWQTEQKEDSEHPSEHLDTVMKFN